MAPTLLRNSLTATALIGTLAFTALPAAQADTAGADAGATSISATTAATQAVSNATMTWSIRDSFISYINSPLASGTISATGGVTYNKAAGNFTFSTGTGTLTNGSGTITYPGTIAFTGHKGELDMKFSNIRIKLAGNSATVILDAVSKGYNGSADVNAKNVEFATFTLSSTVKNQKLTGTATGGQLTEAGAAAFAGFYGPGNRALSDFTFTATVQEQATYVFTDVPAGYAFGTEISWLAQRGITTGWLEADGTRTFRPQENISRGAIAAFIFRLSAPADYKAPAVSRFKDVPTSHPFYREISWLAEKGITTGWSDGTFRPEENVSRAAMAAFFYRLAGSPAYTAPQTSTFKDVAPGAPFYREINWLAGQGITNGWTEPDGTRTYRAAEPIKRDAMAAFIYRYATK